ncbi:fimbrial protein [Photorhabdus tasmaniensis]|uniref:Type 1 fimbrial protein n=1 Tax=Photorhabdus tasmaniensis TaxID=1004159 RepID=A0ABX0GBE3_9GAMM|nr:fimbrial protein [Photorhabdus tasmaniensis]NHB86215.1 type 1 fimbrial protein [Photorhabdus tasmaniensis]
MRKNSIWACLAMVLGIFTSFNALSHDGVIKFRGIILENGCTISSGKDQTVNFGNIPKERFAGNIGTIGHAQSFTINLTNCPGSKIGVKFNGKKDTDDSSLYSSGVSGIGILIAKSGDTKINANTSINDYTLTSANVDIPLIAKLQSTHTEIGDGEINSDVNFTLIYP